ncbi:hypothetical protein BKA69DRAFT_1078109 [Paraphysoderma sedebokerense]|nr:hypothetical protein BKA69DRAFT_1078109 [Paraphysoderma sedebokerense]
MEERNGHSRYVSRGFHHHHKCGTSNSRNVRLIYFIIFFPVFFSYTNRSHCS